MKKTLLILAALALLININAQDKKGFSFRLKPDTKLEGSIGYNFFVSPNKNDAELFRTTIMGFGSGFGDLFATRFSSDLVQLGWEKLYLSLGTGIAINKYRFANNLVLEKDNSGNVLIYDDADIHPERDYTNTFFGYGKSKIVFGSIYFPAQLNWKIAGFTLSAGPLIDLYISGKHKRKYLLDGEKEKDKVGNSEFRNFDLNKVKYGFNVFLRHKLGISLGVTYFDTPFFSNENLPEVREMRIVLGLQSNFGPGSNKSSKKNRRNKTIVF